jgi:alanine dehydrogenase
MRFSDYVDATPKHFSCSPRAVASLRLQPKSNRGDGTFHIKSGSLARGQGYVTAKINGNFPSNRARHGLPTIQGAVYLADAGDGRPLALLDSIEVTLQRTTAATALSARYLARPDASAATICGAASRLRSSSRPSSMC